MQEERAFAIVAAHPWLFATAGFLGFGVNVLSLCVIRLGSGLTLKVDPTSAPCRSVTGARGLLPLLNPVAKP